MRKKPILTLVISLIELPSFMKIITLVLTIVFAFGFQGISLGQKSPPKSIFVGIESINCTGNDTTYLEVGRQEVKNSMFLYIVKNVFPEIGEAIEKAIEQGEWGSIGNSGMSLVIELDTLMDKMGSAILVAEGRINDFRNRKEWAETDVDLNDSLDFELNIEKFKRLLEKRFQEHQEQELMKNENEENKTNQ